jgi:arginine/lysine/ornithine decarboxylase
MNKPIGALARRALIIDDELHDETAAGRASRALLAGLAEHQIHVITATSVEDGLATFASDSGIQCVLLDWDLKTDRDHAAASTLLKEIRARNARVPVFLLANRSSASTISAKAMADGDDFVWLLEDTTDFITGRIFAAIERYRDRILPPMFAALADFATIHEYSWHTPGHAGGTAFLKSPVGRAFFEFFGESLLRSDLSISVGELGSLLDHSGPIGDSERYAARVFGAHRSYTVTNGTSTSNRVVVMASVTRNQVALCDRNCHKSIEHSMTLSGAIPTYLMPSRNHYGIIGPILPERLTPEAVKRCIGENALVKGEVDATPVHAIITNSTYDGLCYNVTRVEELLGASVDRLHFDEAWYAYARFNPIYRDRFAMHGDPGNHGKDKPTVFATHSTHKLLAALSQASFIHVRDGRRPIEHGRFNEAFMMHASTSPQYAIIASNDVSAAMMDGPGGESLTTESIREAVGFRQMVARINAEYAAKDEWFFNVWQPAAVREPKTSKMIAFHEAPEELLVREPGCWVLHPQDEWHGFAGLEDGYCMLDPIKVSLLAPGLSKTGALEAWGIPASVLTLYLDQQGIVVEKTTNFTILILFSLGITKGKWGTLVNAMLDFKRDYDANAPLSQVLPQLVEAHPSYRDMGLKNLAQAMFEALRTLRGTALMAEAFSTLPTAVFSPIETYERLVRGGVEQLTLEEMAGRIVATGIVPYPPGIPLMMPGESAGAADGPILGYLKALEAFDRQFPGFTHETHGIEVTDGVYRAYCLKK